MAIWLGHRFKVMSTHTDLKNIEKIYSENEKCGFWVAELISDEANAIKTPKGNWPIKSQKFSKGSLND